VGHSIIERRQSIFGQPEKISPKMPFYANQDITTYMFVCITECHENYDKDEQRENKKVLEGIVYNNNRHDLKNMCEDFLSIDIDTSTNVFHAIMNTIDLGELLENLQEFLEDIKNDESSDEEDEEKPEDSS
jgi:hypothetical protein